MKSRAPRFRPRNRIEFPSCRERHRSLPRPKAPLGRVLISRRHRAGMQCVEISFVHATWCGVGFYSRLASFPREQTKPNHDNNDDRLRARWQLGPALFALSQWGNVPGVHISMASVMQLVLGKPARPPEERGTPRRNPTLDKSVSSRQGLPVSLPEPGELLPFQPRNKLADSLYHANSRRQRLHIILKEFGHTLDDRKSRRRMN